MADGELLGRCREDRFLGKGSGGQKRNKTSNGVRLSFDGLSRYATDSRSLERNRHEALVKLKTAFALRIDGERLENPPTSDLLESLRPYVREGSVRINRSNRDFVLFAGNLLDLFIASDAWHSVAERIGISVSQLKKWSRRHPFVLPAIQKVFEAKAPPVGDSPALPLLSSTPFIPLP